LLGFKRSGKKIIHKNKFNRKKRLGNIKDRMTFYLKISLVLMIVPAVSLAFIFIYDCVTQSEYFTAKIIRIKGTDILSKEEIIKESGISPGDNIFAINISKVRRKLLANPWTAEVEVKRMIPSEMAITIKEHKCLAVLDLGKKYLLNEQGEVFKEKDVSDAEGVPIIQGLSFLDLDLSGSKNSEQFDAVMTVLKLGRKPECILPNSKIKFIQVDREIGLTIIAFEENRIIKIGYGNYQDKYERLKTVHNQVNNEMNFKNYETIYLDNGLDRVVVCPAIELPSDEVDNNVVQKAKSPGKQVRLASEPWFFA